MSSIQPDDRSSEVNRTEKVNRTLVVARCNRSILLEFGKKVFNQMTGFVQMSVVDSQRRAVATRRNHGSLAFSLESVNHPLVGIIAPIGKQRIRHQFGKELVRSLKVTGLSRREMKA